jgi:hypothetical protein
VLYSRSGERYSLVRVFHSVAGERNSRVRESFSSAGVFPCRFPLSKLRNWHSPGRENIARTRELDGLIVERASRPLCRKETGGTPVLLAHQYFHAILKNRTVSRHGRIRLTRPGS